MDLCCRCVAQMTVVGLLLVPPFMFPHWWLTMLYGILLMAVSAAEAVSRPSHAYQASIASDLKGISSNPYFCCPTLLLLLAALAC